MQESNFNVIIDTENYNAVIGEVAKIDVGQAINYIKSGEAEIEQAVDAGIAEFDANATAKTNAFNQNATDKTTAFNNNASAKTQDYNDNAVAKTTTFNDNATSKTNDFNTNATNKTNAFNQNATDKTLAFNTNAAEKQAAVDASAVLAASFANQSKQYAIGDPTEPLGNSAKYWAEQASSSLSGLAARVNTIEGKIPSTATANNQLTDKSYVDNADSSLQQQIDAITAASDVTDIVGTYAELQAYDTSTLQNNNIIKVLQDETHNNETTYYRWVITGGVGAWVLIGEEGPYYTIAAADAAFQEKLVSGTNIKTVNGNSLVGSGNVDIDALPSQTGQGGKFLTTNGTTASWAEASVTPDNKSISKNTSNALQAIGVIDQNNPANALGLWHGTQAEYDALATHDANTRYDVDGYGVFIGDVQIAAGSSQLNNPFSLLDYKYSEYELSNTSWLLSNGQWNNGAVYQSVYNLLLQIYNGTTTKAGVSVKLSTETYADTDFVLNTSDTTFRLPIKVLMAGSKRVAGNGMTLGLTDGTNNFGIGTTNTTSGTPWRNVLYGANVGISVSGSALTSSLGAGVTTDETKSGIETSANGLYLYFYVGETVQDANIIAAASVLTDVADLKAHSIVETYVNGDSWYRLYSDGWCEQGGIVTGITNSYSTKNLVVEMADTNYTLLANTADIFSGSQYSVANAVSTTTFQIKYTGAGTVKCAWQACGYIS